MNYNAMTPYELGESASKEALPHLIVYLHNGTDNDKRLAASALLKLIAANVNCYSALPFLLKNINSPKPQVRQYTLKALREFQISTEYYGEILEIYNNDEKDYNRELAREIIESFNQASYHEPVEQPSSRLMNEMDSVISQPNTVNNKSTQDNGLGYVYFLQEDFSGRVKIGKTKDLNQRLDTFNVKLPFGVTLIHHIESQNHHYTEKLFHILFEQKRVNGEWFELEEADINYIKNGQYTSRILQSISNPPQTKQNHKKISATEKQITFLTALLETSRLMLLKPSSQLSATEAAALIGYFHKGETLPRELLAIIQAKEKYIASN